MTARNWNGPCAAALAAAALLWGAAGCAADGGDSSPPIVRAEEAAVALDAEIQDTDGRPHRLSADLAAGRPVALVFWQPWCGSCMAEVPTVVAAHRRFGDEMTIYGVVSGPEGSVDEDAVTKARFDTGMTYPSLRDTDLLLTRACGVSETPTVVIVDPSKGVVYRENTAPAEWHGE